MLISTNNKPSYEAFTELVHKTCKYLNEDAVRRPDYYLSRNGTKLEEDIFELMVRFAKETVFEDTIELISNQRFPDIIASKYYGVEVKTSKGKNWTSTGSSIVESTRIQSVERIFLLFGKLSEPVEFRARPYEECLSDIVVTHSPRYKIDMSLSSEDTIFEKMDVEYDQFRNSESSINRVQEYYKTQLKQGQKLWWITEGDLKEESSVSPIVKLWSSLDAEEKKRLQIEAFAWFSEIFGSSQLKYNRLALWLATHKSTLNTSLRDLFSAGGKQNINTNRKKWVSQPQIFHQLFLVKDDVIELIIHADEEWLRDIWEIGENPIQADRLKQWIDLIVCYSEESRDMLYDIFEL